MPELLPHFCRISAELKFIILEWKATQELSHRAGNKQEWTKKKKLIESRLFKYHHRINFYAYLI